MAEFNVNTARLKGAASSIQQGARKLSSAQQKVESVASGLDGSLRILRTAVNACSWNLREQARKVSEAGTVLNSCAAAYERAENNAKSGNSGGSWISEALSKFKFFPGGLVPPLIFPGGLITSYRSWPVTRWPIPNWPIPNWPNDWHTGLWHNRWRNWPFGGVRPEWAPITLPNGTVIYPMSSGIMPAAAVASLIMAYKDVKWDKSAEISGSGYSFKKKEDILEQKDIPWKKWAKDENGNELKDPDSKKWAKQEATYLEFKEEAKVEGSLLHGEVSGKKGIASGSISADVGKAEAHMEASAGLYGYNDDGTKFISPQINAKMGASFCAVTAAAEGTLGNDLFNVGAKGEVSAGKVAAEGEANVVFRDKNGNFNPQAKLEGSVEAVAAEAKGSISGTIAGVKATGNASVVIGAGAHAKVGVVDGVVKCDIGASLGVGFSVGFEVDTKPIVNAVTSGCKSAWKTVTGWFK